MEMNQHEEIKPYKILSVLYAICCMWRTSAAQFHVRADNVCFSPVFAVNHVYK